MWTTNTTDVGAPSSLVRLHLRVPPLACARGCAPWLVSRGRARARGRGSASARETGGDEQERPARPEGDARDGGVFREEACQIHVEGGGGTAEGPPRRERGRRAPGARASGPFDEVGTPGRFGERAPREAPMSRPSSGSGSEGYSFHNVCPRSRNERRALGDKDSLEKARLAQREGKDWDDQEQARRLNPVKPLQDSLSFATESERFSTDVAAQDAERRSRERDAQKVRAPRGPGRRALDPSSEAPGGAARRPKRARPCGSEALGARRLTRPAAARARAGPRCAGEDR